MGITANESVFLGARFRSNEQKSGSAIGRSDGKTTLASGKTEIEGRQEPKPVAVEVETALLIANENSDAIQPDVRIRTIRVKAASMSPESFR